MIERIRVTSTLLPKVEEHLPIRYSINKKTAICLTFLAATAVFILGGDQLFKNYNLQLCWLFSQVGLYTVLHHGVSESESAAPISVYQILRTATDIAPRILAIIGPIALLLWQGTPSFLDVSVAILLKAIRWMAVLCLVSHKSMLRSDGTYLTLSRHPGPISQSFP